LRWIISAWLALVTALSLAPLAVKDQLGTTGPHHDLGHLFALFITTILLCWTARGMRSKLLRCLGACCIGVALELLERAIYHDHMEWHDVGIDSLGAVIGLAVVSVMSLIWYGMQKNEVSPEG
jgi:hypothetical protein